MTAEERLKEIAAILDDWDGYRTAKGLAGLINEVWAYALYPVKAQESVKPIMRREMDDICSCIDNVAYCGKCGTPIGRLKQNYCMNCGQAVKWDK